MRGRERTRSLGQVEFGLVSTELRGVGFTGIRPAISSNVVFSQVILMQSKIETSQFVGIHEAGR
jgi:hypothetical protein